MSITWYLYASGSDTNGGGFDPLLGGINYANQTSSQVVFDGSTIAAHAATATATIVLTGYTVAATDVGNYFNITGGTGFITGRYEIISVNVGLVTWTLSSTCTTGVATGATGKMGGAMKTSAAISAIRDPSNFDFVYANPSDFTASGSFTINHTKVPNTDKTGSVVALVGTYSGLATASLDGKLTNSSGYDLIFASDIAGTNQLPWERVVYNVSIGKIEWWVPINLSTTVNTPIYVWVGNTNITTDITTNEYVTWQRDTTVIDVLMHGGNGVTASVQDSSINQATYTNHGATATGGQLGGALSFASASSQYVSLTAGGILGTLRPRATTMWVQMASLSTTQTVWGGSTLGPFVIQITPTTIDLLSNGSTVGSVAHSLSVGIPFRLTVGYDGSGNWKIRVNGNTLGSGTNPINPAFGNPVLVGSNAGTNYFNGWLDEIRMRASYLDDDWDLFEYNNESSPDTFYTFSGFGTIIVPARTNKIHLFPTGNSPVDVRVGGTNICTIITA